MVEAMKEYEVVICGAGISGLSTAVSLVKKGLDSKKLLILESSNRCGGNVESRRINDNLVEIGPGLGALTDPVCERVNALTVIELDRDLAKRLRHHPFHGSKLTIVEQDALTVDFNDLAKPDVPLRVFGNLPYNISTPIMFHLFSHAGIIGDMHFMLQKEVVNRLAASPGNKNYGRLSVMAQYYCKVQPVLNVPPGAFVPPPKVESAVVRLTPHPTPVVTVSDVKMLERGNEYTGVLNPYLYLDNQL